MLDEYEDVFNDKIGRLKGYKARIQVDEKVQPYAQDSRRIPYHFAKAAEEEIDELIKNDILEEQKNRITWLSQLKAVPKPKKPSKVLITVDAREVNTAI